MSQLIERAITKEPLAREPTLEPELARLLAAYLEAHWQLQRWLEGRPEQRTALQHLRFD